MKWIIVLAMIFAIGLADSCGGNCPTGKCPTCFCGTTKKMEDITAWCAKYNWDQSCCKCIVSHESGGNAHQMNYNINGSTDVGLWQINNINWGSCSNGLRSQPQSPMRYKSLRMGRKLMEIMGISCWMWLLIYKN
jgi:hypothetical protein